MELVRARLNTVETVACLGCGKVYAKPCGRGTLSTNPGCPECGYVGWLPSAGWLSRASWRGRSGEDLQQRRRLRSG